ncbi:MAG: PLP-dependent transferase [Planctomycetota bacterium]|nr:MAG: PLP-dependent transferase [Planctomycetota bacterium]
MEQADRFDTRAVHAGWTPEQRTGAVMPPIYMTSTYVQDAPGRPRAGYEYSRTQNPTRFALQDALASLEGAACGFTFASGMAAIHTLLLTFQPGDRIVAGNDLYGGSHRLFHRIQARWGLRFEYRDLTRAENLRKLPPGTRLLYLETPSNPLLGIIDLRLAVDAARAAGAEVCVDNTFATPALQRPLELGADYVIHSTTKYIGGHSDVVGGALLLRDGARKDEVWFHQNAVGAVNSPFDAFLTLRGLRTLHLRMQRHSSSAQLLAEYLLAHPRVRRTYYPGLPDHPNHAVARAQMQGFGGMISFELESEAAARRFLEGLRIFALAESLGGVESLVELPAPMTHASLSAEQRAAIGIADGLVRLSVGIEDPADLRADLERGFARIGA